MKENLFYLFALICSMGLFIACDNDNDPDCLKVTGEGIAGNYKGTLDIKLDETTVVFSSPENITVSKAGNSTIDLLLADPTLMTIDLGDIELKDCQLNQKDNSYSFTGTQSLSIDQYQLMADVRVAGTIEDDKITVLLDIAAELNGASQKVQVTYTGTKLTDSGSSEVKITTLTFDSKFMTEQPVISEEESTVIFKVDGRATAVSLSALTPVVTISEGTVVTPGSGEAKDFLNEDRVAHTVLSEDYSRTKMYTAFAVGTQKMKEYSLGGWSKDTSNSEEYLQLPAIGTDHRDQLWTSCNQAVMLIKSLGMHRETTYTGDYPVRPTDNVISGKAILMESVFTTEGVVSGTPIPKVTAATAFTGTLNAVIVATEGDTTLSTKFSVMFPDRPLEVEGSLKYTAGTPFYNKEGVEVDKKDECALSAVLYEVEDEKETLRGGNAYTTGDIVASVMLYSGDQKEYAPFSLKLIYHKEYDVTKKYKFAVIFSTSKDGITYGTAVGSKLLVDSVPVIRE